MAHFSNLPFARGDTYFGIGTLLTSATEAVHLEGRRYFVKDTEHNTGQTVTLQIVRSKLSTKISGARGVRYGATAAWQGTKVRGYVATIGDYGVVVDDAYATTSTSTGITTNDLFYVVTDGPCNVRSSTATATMSANQSFGWDSQGRIEPTDGTSNHVVGRVDIVIASGTTGNLTLCHVGDTFAHGGGDN